jgi:RNA polymerase sigma-54 factor
MELFNGLILEQRQILTQSQMQSLSILAMNNQELSAFMQKEFLENPLLEFTRSPKTVSNLMADLIYLSDKRNPYKENYFTYGNIDYKSEKETFSNNTEDLRDHIMLQLYHKSRSKDEWDLIEILIDCLDDNGYFTLKPQEVSEFSGYSVSLVVKCLKDLKNLEPVGIFSENLSECLLKQMKASGITDERLILIVKDYLPDIIKGRVKAVSSALGISAQELRKYISEIGKLNPSPGLMFSKAEPEYIIPDAIVDFYDGQWSIKLNDKSSNEYKCNDYYLRLMRTSSDQELLKYLNERFERCRFVLDCIEQRKKTLFKIVNIIAEYQKEHFLFDQRLKPMSLSDIAIRAGVHASTVSRAIKGKYIQYMFGTVLIKSLFSSFTIEENGQKVSVEHVRALIREIVASECKYSPLSDLEILKAIEARGVKMSRRTIAKYRSDLGISDSHQRRYGL